VAGVTTQFLRLSTDEIMRLAADPAVLLVEPYATPTLLDERASQIAAANLSAGVPTGPGYLAWLASKGFPGTTFDFAIDVTDEGLDNGTAGPPNPDVDHPDLYEGGLKPGTDRVAYATDYTSDSNPRDCGGHGTNVASIAAGYNDQPGAGTADAEGFQHGLGVAPNALVGASKMFECDGSAPAVNFTDITAAAYAGGARISNNSWGFTGSKLLLGRYTDSSREYDALVRDAQPSVPGNQEMVEVFAAGNKGEDVAGSTNEGYASVTPPATAKNVISVGASEGVRSISITDGCGVPDTGANNANDVIDFSSRGPTNDMRLKPDLVAPGTHVVGARPSHGAYNGDGVCPGQSIFPAGTLYNLVSGTSQAAPVVAGAAALVRDWYRREHGGGTEVPSPALTKAILTNAATDIAGGADGKGSTLPAVPSNDAGWGRVNLARALDGGPREFVDQGELLTTGDDELRSYAVPSAGEPVRVTLAWTDPPPATAGGDAFVNDLDLEVSAGGKSYLGNVLVDGFSRTGGEADFRNNLESVVLPAGTADRLSVRVVAKSVGVDGVPDDDPLDAPDQDFALVVSNATEQVSPILVHEETAIDDSLQGNGDGVLDPGESFTVTEEIGNAGDDAATGVTGTLGGAGLLNVTQPASPYPDIGAGGSQENDVPFEANLAGAATCGVDAAATLQVTSDPGVTQQIPIAIPTGRPGVYFDRSRSVGVAIPDDSTAGLSSTIDETRAGRIKDIDIRIVSLTHSWVGDLVIDITAPDGTRVRLAEHPGGPDNSANNFTNTRFDDEAATSIAAGSAPYTGSFRPQHDSLSRFDGKPLQGTWTLRVRDLFEGDTGSLVSWGTSSSAAVCSPDIFPPDTAIDAGPQSLTNSRSATFSFSSEEAGSTFECKLDGEQFVPCQSPKGYSGLGDGEHTFQVVAFDGLGQPDASPAVRSWSVDGTPPQVSVASPQAGSAATSDTPPVGGAAGTAVGDGGTVTLKLFQGLLAAGLPTQTLVLPRDATTGAWAGRPAALAPGTWTVRAEQTDAAGNLGVSAPSSFKVVPAPGFVVAPAEESLSEALAGRLRVLAACTTACRASAKLTVSRRTARRLGLGTRSGGSLGDGSVRRTTAGSAAVRVPVDSRARKVLRGRASTKATLQVTVTGDDQRLSVKRGIVLRRSAGLRRIARSGLRLWAACTRACPLTARVSVSSAEARRLGLRRTGSAPMELAAGGANASTGTTPLTLKVSKGARRKLERARTARVLLQVVAGTAPDLRRSASLRLTLRR
jgi:subtilisin-like proprotein convertase family protein